MVWTHSPYPCLKLRGQQLTNTWEKENYKHFSLLIRGYKHQQLKGKVSSLKCSLFIWHEENTTTTRSSISQCVVQKGAKSSFFKNWEKCLVGKCTSSYVVPLPPEVEKLHVIHRVPQVLDDLAHASELLAHASELLAQSHNAHYAKNWQSNENTDNRYKKRSQAHLKSKRLILLKEKWIALKLYLVFYWRTE